MFKFLKDKLKTAISKFSKKTEEESEKEVEEKIEKKEEEIKELEKEKKALEKREKEVKKKLVEKKKEKSSKTTVTSSEKKEKSKKKPKKEEKEETTNVGDESPKPKKVEEKKPKKETIEKPQEIIEEPEEKEEIIEEIIEEKEEVETVEELEKEEEEIKQAEEEIEKVEEEVKEEKRGFFAKLTEKITKTKLSDSNFEKIFWDLEIVLLENNVAVEVIEKIKDDLKKSLVDQPIPRGKIEERVINTLKDSINEVLSVEELDILAEIKKKKPYVICFIGVNGSGKTTSIAKVTNYLKKNNLTTVIAAADTFRAAAIDQMQIHADKLNVRLIKHDYGADAAAVAFDAVKHAEAKGIDVVLIDTAGRMHSNSNLMDEMKKIVRVAKPDLKVFVGESIVGNDCIEQAKQFNETVGIDAIILSKADVDEKGGASISISYVTKKPIIFIGTGQEYDDIAPFKKELVLETLGL